MFLALPVGLYLVSQKTNFFQKAFGVEADLKVDFNSTFLNFDDPWRNLAQGGEEKGRMSAPIIGKVKKLQPNYIRIDHIYDFYNIVSRNDDNSLSFNWSEFDLTIADIQATGATPFISLSYMPPIISKGDITDLPVNWGEWELVVQKTIEHISGRSGLNINNIYYEVWNEPDLFGKFKTYGDKNYLDLYYHSSNAAKRASNVNEFKFGGPATTDFYSNWMDKLVEANSGSGARLDFLSFHKYSKDLGDIESIAQKASELGVETIVSEFGINSENDKAYDGMLSAIHTIASTAILDGKVSKVFNFEIKDGPGPEKYWGRWGILTHEKFGTPEAKDRFRALEYLNEMTGARILMDGQGTWVKAFGRRGSDFLKIMVVNYDTYGSHIENAPVTFSNIPAKSFTLREKPFGGQVKETFVENSSDNWSTTVSLNPNSATMLELSWQE